MKKKKERIEESKKLIDYTFKNIEQVCKVVYNLKDEVQALINQVNNANGKLSFKKKLDIKKIKAKENLNYLYLIKDNFLFLTKIANGLTLKVENYVYIVKFTPFFDGIKVLEIDDEDDSLLGEFKEIGNEFKEMFIGGKKEKSIYI